jgi:alcohol dehydrogenase class IV
LTGDPSSTVADGIQWVRNFCAYTKIRKLSTYGFTTKIFDKIVDNAVKASSMKGNPIQLTDDELRSILEKSL